MKIFIADVDGVPADVGDALLRGKVVILPTDTIYGLSARADDPKAVARLDKLKGRARPSTLIPHDVKWLARVVERKQLARTLAKYRGDTLLLPRKKGRLPIAASLASSGLVGVRQPKHWITAFVEQLGVPVVTTSVNKTGEPPMTSLDDLDPRVARGVAMLVYEGPRAGRPSDLVYFDGPRPRRVVRAPAVPRAPTTTK